MENNKRPETMARITTKALADAFIEEQLVALREQIGDKKVLLALLEVLLKIKCMVTLVCLLNLGIMDQCIDMKDHNQVDSENFINLESKYSAVMKQ